MTRSVSLPVTPAELALLDTLADRRGLRSRIALLQALVRSSARAHQLSVDGLFERPAPLPRKGRLAPELVARIGRDSGTLAEIAARHRVAVSTVFKIKNGFYQVRTGKTWRAA